MLLGDGFRTIINVGGVYFREKETQPPGMDTGGPVDTTTMRNNFMRTMQPKHLATVTEIVIKAQYDPAVLPFFIVNYLGQNGQLSIGYPDGSIISIWGWVDKLIPDSHKEGEMPLATITVQPSNQDNSGNEQLPTYTAP